VATIVSCPLCPHPCTQIANVQQHNNTVLPDAGEAGYEGFLYLEQGCVGDDVQIGGFCDFYSFVSGPVGTDRPSLQSLISKAPVLHVRRNTSGWMRIT
jgi:hypothetical protein